jgi:ribosomal-protein-alanine N-acetyltransferase
MATLETARLWLRPFTLPDVPQLVPLIGAREVAATTLRIPHPYTEENAREFLTNPKHRCEEVLGIIRKADQQLVGAVGLHPDMAHKRAELGYWIGVPYWGNGYATEAARAVVAYGFGELDLNRIYASHFEGNNASARVLQKIGMRHEGCQRGHILKWGRFLDSQLYGMLRPEWRP